MGAIKKILKGLLIDDDSDFIKIAKAYFTKINIELDTTQSIDSFQKMAKIKDYEFFVIDLNLDEQMEGLKVLENIKKTDRFKRPVFMLSANSSREVITHALELGADDYFTKPMDIDLIAGKLNTYFSSDELEAIKLPTFKTPANHEKCKVLYDFEFNAVDEYGIYFREQDLISIGTSFLVESDFFDQLIGEKKKLRLVIKKSIPHREPPFFDYYAEFEDPPENLLERLRNWLRS